MNDIHQNMAPISIPTFTLFDWIILIIFIGLIALTIFSFWFYRSKEIVIEKKIEEKILELPKRRSWKQELKNLEKFIKEEEWKDFAHSATHLLKLYFSEEKQINMLEKTTEEISNLISDHIHFEEIKKFFLIVDPVKFAGESGKKEKSEKALETLRLLIKN